MADQEMQGAEEFSVSGKVKSEDVIDMPLVKVCEEVSVSECVSHLTKKQLDFKPQSAVFWKSGEHVPFLFLAHGLDSESFLPFLFSLKLSSFCIFGYNFFCFLSCVNDFYIDVLRLNFCIYVKNQHLYLIRVVQ
mgnify:FL=1